MKTAEQQQPASMAFAALLFGAAGFVAGVLMAPKSGKETREDIAHTAKDIKEKASSTAHDFKDRMKHRSEDLKNVASDTANDIKETTRKAKSDAEDINR